MVIGLTFLASMITKMRSLESFVQTIIRFQIIPEQFSRVVAFLFLCLDAVIIICLTHGGQLLLMGFILALFALVLFSWALQRVLARGIQTGCNCFSNNSSSRVTPYDIWRNMGFIGWALVGLNGAVRGVEGNLMILEFLLCAIVALLFFAIWIHVGEIIELLQL
jgi:hypothetical protein